jgi:hypothetical protein
MKLFTLFLAMICSSGLFATQDEPCFEQKPWYLKLTPEVRVSYHHFTGETNQEVMGDGVLHVAMGATYPFYFGTQIWASIGRIYGCGFSLYEGDLTTLDILPVNLGIRVPCGEIPFSGQGYIQAGPSYYHMVFKNNSEFIRNNYHKQGAGAFVGAGGQWEVKPGLILNLFTEYSHRWCNHIRPSEKNYRHHFYISGWDFGGGVSYMF